MSALQICTLYKSMNENTIYYIWLSMLSGIGNVLAHRLLKKFINPEYIYKATYVDLLETNDIGVAKAAAIIANKDLSAANDILKKCTSQNIDIIHIDSENFPLKLKSNNEMPILIYGKGGYYNPKKTVGIVGPRKCSRTDRENAIKLADSLSKDNCCIVSGMAIGIDAYAHTAALKKDKPTIAVLGNGVDICYPSDHLDLYRAIINNGSVISEYPPGARATRYSFPERNKIIAGLSDELYVIGSGKKSGSLITASFAEKYERKVYYINCASDSVSCSAPFSLPADSSP